MRVHYVAKNPYEAGTKDFEMYEKLRRCSTVREARLRGRRHANILKDLQDGRLTVLARDGWGPSTRVGNHARKMVRFMLAAKTAIQKAKRRLESMCVLGSTPSRVLRSDASRMAKKIRIGGISNCTRTADGAKASARLNGGASEAQTLSTVPVATAVREVEGRLWEDGKQRTGGNQQAPDNETAARKLDGEPQSQCQERLACWRPYDLQDGRPRSELCAAAGPATERVLRQRDLPGSPARERAMRSSRRRRGYRAHYHVCACQSRVEDAVDCLREVDGSVGVEREAGRIFPIFSGRTPGSF